MGLWLIDVLEWVILGVSKSFWCFIVNVIPKLFIQPWFVLIFLSISIITVREESSEEVSDITSLFSSMTEGGLAFLSVGEGISAPIVSVR